MEPAMTSLDSFKCCRTLKVGSKTYAYYSLPIAEKNGLKGISRLPFSLKVLLENMLRNEDGRTVSKEDIQAFAIWLKNKSVKGEKLRKMPVTRKQMPLPLLLLNQRVKIVMNQSQTYNIRGLTKEGL